MKSAVIVFPGSNCDRDAYDALTRAQECEPALSPVPCDVQEHIAGTMKKNTQEAHRGGNVIKVWHGESELPKVDLVVLPGGFSYGDYLRSGAMAAKAPIMDAVRQHAERGGLVLGICNGFQILTEAGLLPGVLLRNKKLKFICRRVHLRVENAATRFTEAYAERQVVNFPIAHHDGNYFADEATLDALENNAQVAFRYCDPAGNVTPQANPNGSARNIAGIFNKKKNVLGLMPHPERSAETLLGGEDGAAMFRALAA